MDNSTRKMLEHLRPPANQTGLVKNRTATSRLEAMASEPAQPNFFGAGLTCVGPLIRL
jgi:hypothetical protein